GIASGKPHPDQPLAISPLAADALAGLRVHRRLRAGSPNRCAASPPGNPIQTSLWRSPRWRLTP
ncbi:hypothetical protein, partial [Raoultella planticola]|uniref:hypothetical protein n=1 Tax=Raoultella planticola TaxID=575 RepID=UPI00223B5587